MRRTETPETQSGKGGSSRKTGAAREMPGKPGIQEKRIKKGVENQPASEFRFAVSDFQEFSGDLPVPGGGGGLQGLHGNAFGRTGGNALLAAHAESRIHPVLFLEFS